MHAGPIIVGVDGSPEAAAAAGFGWTVAQRGGVECRLVHATRSAWSRVRELSLAVAATASAVPPMEGWAVQAERGARRAADARVRAVLEGRLPVGAEPNLTVQLGRAAPVIANMASDLDAQLVVVGGKRHSTLGRWLGGSTAHQLARLLERPLLVTADPPPRLQRILVAVDCSERAPGVIALAERYAALFDGALRVVHVVERLPDERAYPGGMSQAEFFALCEGIVKESVWPTITRRDADRVVREGDTIPTIEAEVERWGADLLAVGSHGVGYVSRLLLGSVTESLLNDLPTSVLIAPASRA